MVRTKQRGTLAADKTDEGDHHNQRTRCGLAEGEAINHLRRCQPLVTFDCTLEYVKRLACTKAFRPVAIREIVKT